MMTEIKKKDLPTVRGKNNYSMWISSTMRIKKIPDWFSLSRKFSVLPLLPKHNLSLQSFFSNFKFSLTQYFYLQF